MDRAVRRQAILGLLSAELVLISYWLIWGSVDGFVRAIDHDEQLFSDFRLFYYPMGKVLLEEMWPVGGYYYTSFFALGLSVVALWPMEVAVYLWGILQVGLVGVFFAVSGRWLLGLEGRGMMGYLLLLLSSFPLLHNFKWGQVSVLMALGVVLAFALPRRSRSAWGGVVLALVTCIKYYPGVFAVDFLLRRDWRAVAGFAAGLLGFYVVVPLVFLGPSGWWYFERASMQSLPGAALLLDDFNTQYFPHVIKRLGVPLGYGVSAPMLGVLRLVGIAVFVANCFLVWWLYRRDIAHKAALAAAALLLTLPFIVQTSWPHYFVYLPFCQAALWLGVRGVDIMAWKRRLLSGLIVFSTLITSAYFFALFPSWRIYNGMGLLWLSDAVLLAVFYGWVLVQRKSDSP